MSSFLEFIEPIAAAPFKSGLGYILETPMAGRKSIRYDAVACISVTVVPVCMAWYWIHRSDYLESLTQCSQTIARVGAAAVDGDALEKVIDRKVSDPTVTEVELENMREYTETQSILRRIFLAVQTNQAYGVKIRFAYTMYPDPLHAGNPLFVVDGDAGEKVTHVLVGQSASATYDGEPISEDMTALATDPYPIVDEYGSYLTSHAPIYDTGDNFVGAFGVDIPASEIEAALAPSWWATFGVSTLAVSCAVFFLIRLGSEKISVAVQPVGAKRAAFP